MREELLIYVHFDTTLEDIQLLKNEMRNFVRDKDNCRDFQPDIEIEVTGISEMNKMELQVEIKHKSNWSNETVRSARRSKFMCALVLALRKIPIYAPGGGDAALGSSDKPTYSVAVSDAEAAKARDAYAATKEGKRMVPTKKPSTTEKNPFGSSTAVDATPDPQDPATPPPLRYRLPPLTEQAALTDLNSRDPAADTALDRRLSDRSSPPNRTPASEDGGSSLDRKASIEEVRGLLRRQSTRGKRRPSASGAPYASAQGTQSGLGLNVPTPVQEGNDSPSEYFGQMAPPSQAYPPQQQGYPRREQSQDPYLQQAQQAQRYQIGAQGQQGQAVRPGDLEAGIGAGAQMRQVRQPAPGAGNSLAMDRRREE